MVQTPLEAPIEAILKKYDFTLHGWAALERPLSFEFYRSWVENGFAGEMDYLREHLPMKENPQRLMSSAKSAIVLAQNYHPHPHGTRAPLPHSRVSLYAQGADYHHWFKERILRLIEDLREIAPEADFLPFVDSGPVLERDLAYRAGLGWIGKNTCLINEKKGSLFFLAEILTSLPLTARRDPAADRCGTCTRCIDVCPTQALVEPRKLDARKCISYLTIESKKAPPEDVRAKMHDWLFGCDLCQTVCPWNRKIWADQLDTRIQRGSHEGLVEELRWILTESHRQIRKKLLGTPLSRAGAKGLKKNAVIVATNLGLKELRPEIQALQTDERFSQLCEWSIRVMEFSAHPEKPLPRR